MNHTLTATTLATAFSPPAQPSRILVRFTGIVNDRGTLYVFLTDGGQNWIIKCDNEHLQAFDIFQGHVADTCGTWIDHRSQQQATARRRAEAWCNAVEWAFERGSAT